MTCPKCHQEHHPDRCSAHNSAGLQCGKAPMNGATVCRTHGGSAPQVKAAAEERQLEAKADGELRKLWVGLENAVAVTDPVASMAQLAGALEQLLDQVGEKVNEISTIGAGRDLSQVRGEIVLLERTASLLAKVLDSMARLGIAERQVQIQQEQAEFISAAFRVGVGAIASSLLTPGDRDVMVRAFLLALGQPAELLEVPA